MVGINQLHGVACGWDFRDVFACNCMGWVKNTCNAGNPTVCLTCNYIIGDYDSNACNEHIRKDLQDADALGACNNASDTTWLFRFKTRALCYDCVSSGDICAVHGWIGDTSCLAGILGCGDRLGIFNDFRGNCSGTEISRKYASNEGTGATQDCESWDYMCGVCYWITVSRLTATTSCSDTFTCACFTCSVLTCGLALGTMSACTVALRYLSFGNRGNTQAGSGTCHIVDCVEFIDGTACPP